MAISKTQRTEINLSDVLENVPDNAKEDAAESIGIQLVDSIKDYLGDGVSPVKGHNKFQKLSPKYAEKKGSDLPNLYLEGDLWASLDYEVDGETLIIGVDSSQEGKSDGHNDFSGDSNLPLRRFLADDGEIFKDEAKIIKDTVPLFESADKLDEIIANLFAPGVISRTEKSVKLGGLSKKDLEDLLANQD